MLHSPPSEDTASQRLSVGPRVCAGHCAFASPRGGVRTEMTFFSSRFLFSENSSGCTRWNRESGFSQLQVRWRRRVLTPAQSPWRSCRSSGGAEGHTGPRCPPSNGPCPWRGACSLGAAFPSPLTESGRARGGPPPAGVHQEGHPNEVVPCHLRATRLGSLHGGRGIPL